MRIRIVFTGFMLVAFALPFGQVADIAHVGQIHAPRREQKRKALTVQAENSSSVTSLTEQNTPQIVLPDVAPLIVSAADPLFFYHDVTGQVSTPPPRARAHA